MECFVWMLLCVAIPFLCARSASNDKTENAFIQNAYPSTSFVVVNIHFTARLGRCGALVAIPRRRGFESIAWRFLVVCIKTRLLKIEYFGV